MMFKKSLTLALALTLYGCPHPDLLTPAEISAQCKESESSRPFMVGWDSNKQDELSSAHGKNKSPIFLKYDGCEMRILTNCRQEVKTGVAYEMAPLPLHDEKIEMKNQRSLYATLPLAASNLQGKISSKYYLLLHYKKNRAGQLKLKNLSGHYTGPDCSQATHYVDQIIFGAYHLKRMKRLDIGLFASLFGGATSEDEMTSEIKRGDLDACRSRSSSSRIDSDCSSIISVGVKPIPIPIPSSPTSPPRAHPTSPTNPFGSQRQDATRPTSPSVFTPSSTSPRSESTSPSSTFRPSGQSPSGSSDDFRDQRPNSPASTSSVDHDSGGPTARLARARQMIEHGDHIGCRESLLALRELMRSRRADVSGHAYYLQGHMYMRGCGVTRNLERAAQFFKEATKRGHQASARIVEKFYSDKLQRAIQMVANNQCREGVKLLQKIKDNCGDAMLSNKASYNIGVAYERGCDAEPDIGRAVEIYQRLTERNYPPALRALGLMYIHGRYFEKSERNHQRGLGLLKRAATAGDDEARHEYLRLNNASND